VSLLFEKPSFRTRFTFEIAVKQLGGDSVLSNGPIAEREPVKDVARNLARWTQAIVARVYDHNTLVELSEWSNVPVINALSDRFHPCQALADMLTLQERFGKDLSGKKLAFLGDGSSNVCHSLILSATRLGMSVAVATSPGYNPDSEVVLSGLNSASVKVTHNPEEALQGADAVYTDVWTSMGQEKEGERRKGIFAKYQVNSELMKLAKPGAVFMHCLPAKREQEVTDEVIESANSLVFEQAENRLHVQKALLAYLLRQ
jgi:ornithine carbamoyltransferase